MIVTGSVPETLLEEASTREEVVRIREALPRNSALYLVGGSVRDAFLGMPPRDLDLATPLLPDVVRMCLEGAGMRVVPTGLRHQTVTAFVHDGGEPVEVTTFHGSGMSPHGGVRVGLTIDEDLAHRDFTINAIAYDLTSHEVIDPQGGVQDITARRIRAVGSAPARFKEDPLRLLRMVRFAAVHHFAIERETAAAAMRCSEWLDVVSTERVRDEFSKILLAPTPSVGITLLEEYRLLIRFLPELCTCVGVEQNRFHRADVFQHTLEVVDRARPDLVLRLAALFHDIAKPLTISIDERTGERHFFHHEKIGAQLTEEILTRLRYPKAVIKAVTTLVSTHMRPIEAGPGGLRRILRDTGELFELWRELKEVDTLSCRVDPEEFSRRLAEFDRGIEAVRKGPPVSPLSSLAVSGNDILHLGIPAGPLVGRVLRALHERVLDDPGLNERETLIRLAKELLPVLEPTILPQVEHDASLKKGRKYRVLSKKNRENLT